MRMYNVLAGKMPVVAVGAVGAGAPTASGEDLTVVQRRRAIRVWMLVATIAVLSIADLYMTLAHLRGAGMGEANPLARLVMSYQSPVLLSVWKCGCVGLACLILLKVRHKRSGEVGCWVCCVLLTALTVHWLRYSIEAPKYTSQISALSGADAPTDWVSMETP